MIAIFLINLINQFLIEFAAAFIAISTILILWKYRDAHEVRFLIIVELLAAIWALCYAIELSTSTLQMKIFWSQISYLGIAFLPLSYFLFTIVFSQKREIINLKNIIILSVIPFLTILFVFTNDWHHLVWKNVRLDEDMNMAIYEHGFWFWIFWTHAIILIITGLYNLYQSIFKFPAFYKAQVRTLLIATFIPLVGNIMYVTGLNPVPGFDWTPLLFIFTGMVVTFGIIRYRMFDLVPFARNKLIDTMKDGVLVVNAEKYIEDCNEAAGQIFNIEPDEVIRKSFNDAFKNFESFVVGISQEKQQNIEISIQHPEGNKIYQSRFSPVLNKNNKFSGFFIQVSDITSIKQAEIELKKINKQLEGEIEKRGNLIDDLDSFSHTVAHDLRNSLGSISSATEVLMYSIQKNDTDSLTEITNLIKNSADKAMHVTEELLTLARISNQDIKLKPLNMQTVVREALFQLSNVIEKSNATIKTPKSWPESIGYAPWIEEIWTNYITNAIKYGGKPPIVKLGFETQNNQVKFWVKDNGDGLSKDEQAKLFNKYVRLKPKRAKGYGIGLTIVKSIANKLGQSYGVESNGKKGEGSLFFFTLPRQND